MASSAIVGAAALIASPAAAQELELSAFQAFVASGGGSDAGTEDRGIGFGTNTEVHVNGTIMADNGITFGFRVEFEADAGETNNVDENSVWASSGFGKLEFGKNDGAEDTFMVNGSGVGVGYGGIVHRLVEPRQGARQRLYGGVVEPPGVVLLHERRELAGQLLQTLTIHRRSPR